MSDTPTARQRKILELLSARRMLTIQELVQDLGVSSMTVHRDLIKLADAGHLSKTRGGATLLSRATHTSPSAPGQCAMCNQNVPTRTAVIIQSPESGHLSACCPHCGLTLLDQNPKATLAMVADFIYGRMVGAGEAAYLVGCCVTLCCEPSILAFTCPDQASSFQKGFGGEIMDLAQALDYLRSKMTIASHG
jgi:DeoR family transcriptional regulator, copper-sensing transcriptional repressor